MKLKCYRNDEIQTAITSVSVQYEVPFVLSQVADDFFSEMFFCLKSFRPPLHIHMTALPQVRSLQSS